METDERVRRYASEVLGCPPSDGLTSVVRFATGDRHAVFRVTYHPEVASTTSDVVVRISLRGDAAERLGAEREAAILEALQGVGAPRLYDFRNESTWFDTPAMCMEFIDGSHRELLSNAPDDVARLGAVVASVHNSAVEEFAEWLPGPRTIGAYVAEWRERIAAYLPKLRELPPSVLGRVERARSLVDSSLEGALRFEAFKAAGRFVLLHGDVGPGNILWSEQPVLIDWEYARLGDPADEVAYIFGQHGLGPSQREAFWWGYRRATAHPRIEQLVERVRWWEPVTLLGSALWWLERWSRRTDADAAGRPDPSAAKPENYYLDQVVQRLDRFDMATVH